VYIAAPGIEQRHDVGGLSLLHVMLLLFARSKTHRSQRPAAARTRCRGNHFFHARPGREQDSGTRSLARIEAGWHSATCTHLPGKSVPRWPHHPRHRARGTVALSAPRARADDAGQSGAALLRSRCRTIELDGIDICDIKLQNLRSHIALVSQDVVLFNDTLAHNIAYGSKRDATADEIRRLHRRARLDFIQRCPTASTPSWRERHALSGGQRQRIAIARHPEERAAADPR